MHSTVSINRRYELLDLLRIFAAIFVLVFHYYFLFQQNGQIMTQSASEITVMVSPYGFLGVEIFFMISGYVITVSAENRTRRQFFLARTARLWPTFLICLSITLIFKQKYGYKFEIYDAIFNITMLPRLFRAQYIDPVYWSLMFEIIFYFMIIIFVIGKNFISNLENFLSFWISIIFISRFFEIPDKIKTVLILEYGQFFIVGASIFLISKSRKSKNYAIFSIAMMLCFLFVKYPEGLKLNEYSKLLTFLILILGALTLFCAPHITVGDRAAKLFFILGGISYPLYLLHSEIGIILINNSYNLFGNWSINAVSVLIFMMSLAVWWTEARIKAAYRRHNGRSHKAQI